VTIYSSDGTLRPDFPDDANECVLNDETETFVDTIIASSDTNSMLSVLDFFNIFGLKREGKPEPEKKIGISPVREVGNKFIWKITAADVPAMLMRLILDGQKWDGSAASVAKQVDNRWKKFVREFDVPFADVIAAVEWFILKK